jgi:hypothetical protein
MFFCQCPVIYDFWLDSQEISGKSPKIPGFSIFRVVCKRSTGIILKGACAKADSEMHDKKIHRKYGV